MREKFIEQNVVHMVSSQPDYVIPRELEAGIRQFVETCIDYRIDEQIRSHFINQLTTETSVEPNVSLSTLSGVPCGVINTFIREALVRRADEIKKERDRT